MDILEGLLLKKDFPHLDWNTFAEKSEKTVQYNCVAFAVGDTSRRWWPNADGAYWPSKEEGVPQEETTQAFIAALGSRGYSICNTGDLEKGLEKIALYADSATQAPRHAAHQMPDGRWERKLGGGVDIQHDSLAELAGPVYGEVVCFLRRPIG